MFVVLMVEDDADLAFGVKELAEKELPGVGFHIEEDFDNAIRRMSEIKPDCVILDLLRDVPEPAELVGEPIYEDIWQHRFCPIVVYTARAEAFEDHVPRDHPFVCLIRKGANTDVEVINKLRTFTPHIRGIHEVEERVLEVVRRVLRDVSSHVFAGAPDEDAQRDVLVRAARRRISAVLDHDAVKDGRPLRNWEKYVVPPLEPDVMMADLIREREKAVDDADAYRVVLTPTCDMVSGQNANVSRTLIAKCCSWKTFFTSGASIAANTGISTLKKKLSALLNECYAKGYVLLPEYPHYFPSVAVNLRDLDLVPLSDIGGLVDGPEPFVRIASIDGPFREQIAWSYLQISGRPGAPPCDNTSWAQWIASNWSQED